MVRPKRGAGWWGHGPTLRPHKEGIVKSFVDGAGLPSPGRWSPKRRNLPDDEVAKSLKKVLRQGLTDSTRSLPGGSLRTALAVLTAGKCEASPFAKDVVERTKADLRVALKKAGFGDGLPREGDVEQDTEVRLLQGLLEAFRGPDHFFCEWWSRGVWLGSPERSVSILLRAPMRPGCTNIGAHGARRHRARFSCGRPCGPGAPI